jgi:hypothetical protein
MTSAEPARPAVPRSREPKASVLAALQLVEDARHRTPDRRTHRERLRAAAERAVERRRLDRDLSAAS